MIVRLRLPSGVEVCLALDGKVFAFPGNRYGNQNSGKVLIFHYSCDGATPALEGWPRKSGPHRSSVASSRRRLAARCRHLLRIPFVVTRVPVARGLLSNASPLAPPHPPWGGDRTERVDTPFTWYIYSIYGLERKQQLTGFGALAPLLIALAPKLPTRRPRSGYSLNLRTNLGKHPNGQRCRVYRRNLVHRLTGLWRVASCETSR